MKNITQFFPADLLRLRPTREEIQGAIADSDWQNFRWSLKGLPTIDKLWKLSWWFSQNPNAKNTKVQVVNYLNALKRGGQLSTDGDIRR